MLDDSGGQDTLIIWEEKFTRLKEYRFHILNLEAYGYRGDFFKIQWYREWFSDMQVEELLDMFNESNKLHWDEDREYYYALFNIIEDKLKEKGIYLGFDELFKTGI